MKNLIKLNVIFLGFFIIFSSKSMAAEVNLPLPKPTVDQETKITTAKTNLSAKDTEFISSYFHIPS